MPIVALAPVFASPSYLDTSLIAAYSPSSNGLSALHPVLRIKTKKNQSSYSNTAVITCSSSPHKIVRDPRLDKHVLQQNRMRFVQKLKVLLLSKPKHFMPVKILYKCRSYLCLPKPRSILSMIHRYPVIFELFTIPTPATPFHAAGPLSQLCVRLTPAAAAIAKRESDLKKSMSVSLAQKLQKLLMLAVPYHSLLLSKLVHIGSDLGLPINFRSRLCHDHPDKFKVVDTSYGPALKLVSWDSNLANVLPYDEISKPLGLIVDRPLKFKRLILRKGLNIKRHHHDYLIKFRELPDVCPYKTNPLEMVRESMEAEKRSCAIVREILGMTVEKRTLIDHLTHFRTDFGLSNKLRGMLVRHPEMFYISLKGQRNSVFLVEGYDDKGNLLQKDDVLVIKDELIQLIREGKMMRREQRKVHIHGNTETASRPQSVFVDDFDDYDDGLDDLFQLDDYVSDDEGSDLTVTDDEDEEEAIDKQRFWMAQTSNTLLGENFSSSSSIPW